MMSCIVSDRTFAHAAGPCHLVQLPDNIWCSGGVDGEITFHKKSKPTNLEEYGICSGLERSASVNAPNQSCLVTHKRIHKGEVTCLISIPKNNLVFSGGEDGNVFITKFDPDSSVLQVSSVSSQENSVLSIAADPLSPFIAISRDNCNFIEIAPFQIDFDNRSESFKSQIDIKSPAIAMIWVDSTQLMVAGRDGTVEVWSLEAKNGSNDQIDIVSKGNLKLNLELKSPSKFIKSTKDPKLYTLGCPQNGIFFLSLIPLPFMVDHFKPPGCSSFTHSIIQVTSQPISTFNKQENNFSDGEIVLVFHTLGLSLIDAVSREGPDDLKITDESAERSLIASLPLMDKVFRMPLKDDGKKRLCVNSMPALTDNGQIVNISIEVDFPKIETVDQGEMVVDKLTTVPFSIPKIDNAVSSVEKEKKSRKAAHFELIGKDSLNKEKANKKRKTSLIESECDSVSSGVEGESENSDDEGNSETERDQSEGSAENSQVDSLDGYSVISDLNQNDEALDQMGHKIINASSNGINESYVHYRRFQPCATEWKEGHRFMAWNEVGLITSRQDDGYSSIEIEFHDRLFHRPIRFIDEVGYTLGAVGKAGAIFAREKKPLSTSLPGISNESDSLPSIAHIVPLDTWAKVPVWDVVFPHANGADLYKSDEDEGIVGVAVGDRYALIATDQGFLRPILPGAALQVAPVSFCGDLVSICASGDHCAILTNCVGQLHYFIYSMDPLCLRLLHSGMMAGRHGNGRNPITWMGFCTELSHSVNRSILSNGLEVSPAFAVFDKGQVLQVLNQRAGNVWQPLYSADRSANLLRIWPVSFNFTCIQAVQEGEDLNDLNRSETDFDLQCKHFEPDLILPRPILKMIPMRMPLLGVSTESTVESLDRVLRTAIIQRDLLGTFNEVNAVGGSTTGASSAAAAAAAAAAKKARNASDKLLLELIQLALQGDKPVRVIEYCRLLQGGERSWSLAAELARHAKQSVLADRIDAERHSFPCFPLSPAQSATAASHSELPSNGLVLNSVELKDSNRVHVGNNLQQNLQSQSALQNASASYSKVNLSESNSSLLSGLASSTSRSASLSNLPDLLSFDHINNSNHNNNTIINNQLQSKPRSVNLFNSSKGSADSQLYSGLTTGAQESCQSPPTSLERDDLKSVLNPFAASLVTAIDHQDVLNQKSTFLPLKSHTDPLQASVNGGKLSSFASLLKAIPSGKEKSNGVSGGNGVTSQNKGSLPFSKGKPSFGN